VYNLFPREKLSIILNSPLNQILKLKNTYYFKDYEAEQLDINELKMLDLIS
jgi:hypothetical protein